MEDKEQHFSDETERSYSNDNAWNPLADFHVILVIHDDFL